MFGPRHAFMKGKGWYLDINKRDDADMLFSQCKELPTLSRPRIGKTQSKTKRNIGVFAKKGVPGYWVSKQANFLIPSKPLPRFLAHELDAVNEFYKEDFNLIILNRYENEQDAIGPHHDDGEFNGLSCVVTISLGESRIYRLLDRDSKSKTYDHLFQHGEIITMSNGFQELFTHEIPAHPTPCGLRISLTFRRVLPGVEHFSLEKQPSSRKKCLLCEEWIFNSSCPVCKYCLPLKKFQCPDCNVPMSTPWLCGFCYVAKKYTEDGNQLQ
jgi:alkylated DNA repair dioxygenase AlkB